MNLFFLHLYLMMRIIIISIVLLTNLVSRGQQKKTNEQIYYFLGKDSLLGVKDRSGKIIIKPQYYYWGQDLKKPVGDNLIYLDGTRRDTAEPHSWGMVFNRKGTFLFAPFAFDNGPDGFSEGLMRVVKNGKVGFANRNGDIVIEPKYDFADMFNYGLAAYCNGCVWKNKGEHSFVSGGNWGYINYKGNTLEVLTKRNTEKDQVVDSIKFLPYQFSYSAFEKKLLDSFYKLPMISKTYFVNYYSPLDSNELQLRFEIVERPSAYYPYYRIMAFEYSHKHGFYGGGLLGLNFFVDRTGRDFFVFDYYEKKIPLDKWLKKEVQEAKLFLKTHPDALHKF
jgi:hypothetical protein